MKKCSNCGTEYEGNCCPNCGTWSEEERTCPRCGNKMKAGANFCSNCGFTFGGAPDNKPQKNGGSTFKEKIAKVGRWMKKHLFIVIPVAVVLVVAIILACTIPACVKAKDNGTYYKLKYNGEIDKETYFIIDSGKWSDEDGESGTYKKDGDKIIFYIEFFGSKEEAARGTIKDGVLKVGDDEDADIYISEKHKHKYGDWKTTTEATCTTDGEEEGVCACGAKETRVIKCVGYHTGGEWLFNETSHYKICSVCKQQFDEEKHNNSNYCTVCGYPSVEVDSFKFILNSDSNGYTLVSAEQDKAIIIPAKCKGLPVTAIGNEVFKDFNSLTNITIPDSVTSIGDNAFNGCSSLTNITIPDSVTSIGESAFRNCRLTNILIPDGVTNIGNSAFRNCNSLTSITIGNGVTSIGEDMFSGCSSITSISLPDGVMSIGSSAFEGCTSLKTITISDSIMSIGSAAFSKCENLQYNEYQNALYLGNNKNPYLLFVKVKDRDLTSCNINSNTKIICPAALSFCSQLSSISIPDSVKVIGYWAFNYCSSLTNVTIANGVEIIEFEAFGNCTSLKDITIPNSVTEIEDNPFNSCSSLTSITFKGTKAQWKAFMRGYDWSAGCIIHCTDGDITK